MNPCTARYHDTAYAYRRHGCRCATAIKAKQRQSKLYRAGRAPNRPIDATGTRRRIQALMVLGWPLRTIMADKLGYSPKSYPHRLATAPRVTPGLAKRVAALYDELSMTPGPSKRTRNRALQAGFLPPLAWDDDRIDDPTYQPTQLEEDDETVDEVAVRRALAGDRPAALRREELVAAVLAAHERGLSDPEIGVLLGLKPNTVNAMRNRAMRAGGVSGRSNTPNPSDAQPGQGLGATA